MVFDVATGLAARPLHLELENRSVDLKHAILMQLYVAADRAGARHFTTIKECLEASGLSGSWRTKNRHHLSLGHPILHGAPRLSIVPRCRDGYARLAWRSATAVSSGSCAAQLTFQAFDSHSLFRGGPFEEIHFLFKLAHAIRLLRGSRSGDHKYSYCEEVTKHGGSCFLT